MFGVVVVADNKKDCCFLSVPVVSRLVWSLNWHIDVVSLILARQERLLFDTLAD